MNVSFVPAGTLATYTTFNPALKRWAIFIKPFDVAVKTLGYLGS
jgi:hypothetical protein